MAPESKKKPFLDVVVSLLRSIAGTPPLYPQAAEKACFEGECRVLLRVLREAELDGREDAVLEYLEYLLALPALRPYDVAKDLKKTISVLKADV